MIATSNKSWPICVFCTDSMNPIFSAADCGHFTWQLVHLFSLSMGLVSQFSAVVAHFDSSVSHGDPPNLGFGPTDR